MALKKQILMNFNGRHRVIRIPAECISNEGVPHLRLRAISTQSTARSTPSSTTTRLSTKGQGTEYPLFVPPWRVALLRTGVPPRLDVLLRTYYPELWARPPLIFSFFLIVQTIVGSVKRKPLVR